MAHGTAALSSLGETLATIENDARESSPVDLTVNARLGIPFETGDLVLDTLTGEQGVVIDATITHSVVSGP